MFLPAAHSYYLSVSPSVVHITLLSFLLRNGLTQRPTNPVEDHVAEWFDSPIAPVRVRVTEGCTKAATPTFTFVRPRNHIISICNANLNKRDCLRQYG